ncbi:kanadaptin-like isoform X2 [Penaeus japonicus]|uniref:kanadaptin-like isoform X2 n=1 Tax=Penaeus japonicus TaxID=27405 RepID=UPI001C71582B|nr:kanadaptin-like isoform X2 [Penaeus japonicus]
MDEDVKKEENTEPSSQEDVTEEQTEDFKVPGGLDFKKPVFIAKSQRSTTKPSEEAKVEEEEESKDQPVALAPQKKISSKSPAQQLVEKSVPVPYKEPKWSGVPSHDYSFEILKNGTIVETVALNKPFFVIGRLAQCDITMEHPSVSRFHCVIQYRSEASEEAARGFYAYDLGSTHGSFHNKHQMKPHTYYRLKVGHMIKLGGSTRMMILQGPEEDEEPEMEQTVTELKAAAAKRLEKLEKLESGEIEEDDRERRKREALEGKEEESRGIDWGMGDDAEEGEDGESDVNPFASLNEELYLDDPKKTLRGWYEREGYDLPEYETDDISPGNYRCRLELPVPGPGGGPLVAIAEHRGKKKDVVVQCALEACRLLDRIGILRQAKHESHERKRRDWAENDYYDSDEDNFLDRTGDVERKRLKRMKKDSGKEGGSAETYDSLLTKYKEVIEELSSLEEKLAEADRLKQEADAEEEEDLDSFMQKLKTQVPDKHKRVMWKLRAIELRKEELRLRRLTNVARPFGVQEMKPYTSKLGDQSSSQKVPAEALSRKQMLLKKAAFFTKPQPKEPTFQVHKAFLEEEPEKKLKLKRLDDEDDEPPPPRPVSKPKPKPKPKVATSSREDFKPPEMPRTKSPIQQEERSPVPCTEFVADPGENGRFVVPQTESVSGCMGPPQEKGSAVPESSESKASQDIAISGGHSLTDPAKSNASESEKSLPSQDSKGKTASQSDVKEDTPPGKKQRVMGPALPPTLELVRASQREPKKAKKKHEKKYPRFDEDNPNYDTWVPPARQTGDGRTSLNDKLGY